LIEKAPIIFLHLSTKKKVQLDWFLRAQFIGTIKISD